MTAIYKKQGRRYVEIGPAPTCARCNTPMQPGKAIEQTYTGTPDFPGAEVVTLSPGGPGKLIDCWKCPACGWSCK